LQFSITLSNAAGRYISAAQTLTRSGTFVGGAALISFVADDNTIQAMAGLPEIRINGAGGTFGTFADNITLRQSKAISTDGDSAATYQVIVFLKSGRI